MRLCYGKDPMNIDDLVPPRKIPQLESDAKEFLVESLGVALVRKHGGATGASVPGAAGATGGAGEDGEGGPNSGTHQDASGGSLDAAAAGGMEKPEGSSSGGIFSRTRKWLSVGSRSKVATASSATASNAAAAVPTDAAAVDPAPSASTVKEPNVPLPPSPSLEDVDIGAVECESMAVLSTLTTPLTEVQGVDTASSATVESELVSYGAGYIIGGEGREGAGIGESMDSSQELTDDREERGEDSTGADQQLWQVDGDRVTEGEDSDEQGYIGGYSATSSALVSGEHSLSEGDADLDSMFGTKFW